MSKLKIAVIGTGLVGTFHAEAFFRNPNSELVAVCDVDKEKVKCVTNMQKKVDKLSVSYYRIILYIYYICTCSLTYRVLQHKNRGLPRIPL